MAFNKSFVLTIVILAVVTSISHASDPNIFQDFCVATNDTMDAVLVNGKLCKKYVTVDDFFIRAGLNRPGNTSNQLGSAITAVNVYNIQGLNNLGISLARFDYAPYGLNPPHTNPRGSEILMVCEGTLYVGVALSDPPAGTQNANNNKLFTKILYPGDVFVFPMGLIHFQFNLGKTNAVAFSSFSNEDPGQNTIANAVFGSDPPIKDEVLEKAFQVDKKIVDYIQSQFGCNNNN